MADIKTIDDENFAGKKVLVRVDFNAPVDADGNVTDEHAHPRGAAHHPEARHARRARHPS